MTSVTETSEEASDENGASRGADSAAITYSVLGAIQLVIGAVTGLLAASELVEPELLGSLAYGTFGRMQPNFLNAIVYGWLTMALTGAILFITPRLTGRQIVGGAIAKFNAYFWFALVVCGEGAIKLGYAGGQELLEFPLPVAAGMAISAAITAGLVVATIVQRSEPNVYPSLWYFGAAVIWLPIMIVAANLPIYAGIGQAVQANFFIQNLFGLWLLASGLGVAYYYFPKITGNPLYSKRLALVGFWSLIIFWIFTGPIRMIYAPGGGGIQTVAIAFSITTLIPIWTALANFSGSMRGRWGALSRSAPVRFLVAGSLMLFVYSLLLPLGALRSTQQVVGLTDFLLGTTELLLLGALSCIAAAGVYEVVPRVSGRQWVSVKAANWHLGLLTLGVSAMVVGAWVGGTVQGFTTIAGASAAQPVVTGDAWASIAAPLKWFYTLQMIGMTLFATSAVVFLTNLCRTLLGGRLGAVEEVIPGVAPADDKVTEVLPAEAVNRAVVPVLIPVLSIALIGATAFLLSRVFLWAAESSGKTRATVIALLVTTVIVVVAALISWRPALRGAAAVTILSVGLVVVTASGAYSYDKLNKAPPKSHAGAPDAESAAGNSVDINAKNLVFNLTEMKFKPGPAAVKFDNTDFVLHNVSIYKTSQATDAIFEGANIQAGEKTTYVFTAPGAGDYYFRCDVHPNMNGAVVVS